MQPLIGDRVLALEAEREGGYKSPVLPYIFAFFQTTRLDRPFFSRRISLTSHTSQNGKLVAEEVPSRRGLPRPQQAQQLDVQVHDP